MNFVAVDVETANSDRASICQIGIAVFKDGKLADEWVSLINPEDQFPHWNIKVHGITESHVKDSPKFSIVADRINSYFKDNVVISHGNFDLDSLSKAFLKCNVKFQFGSWLDTTQVARRAWSQFATKGYSLENLAGKIGYKFEHHDALADAKAAGVVLVEAIRITNITLDEWPKRVAQRIDLNASSVAVDTVREINQAGELLGEVIVFTRSIIMKRSQAKDAAARLGCSIGKNVTKKTTLLVVGGPDINKLETKDKSGKHRHAEKNIAEGQPIRILKESDFISMAADRTWIK